MDRFSGKTNRKGYHRYAPIACLAGSGKRASTLLAFELHVGVIAYQGFFEK